MNRARSETASTPLAEALDRIETAGRGLLGIGIPRCPASALLAASLEAVAAEAEGATVAMSVLDGPGDWAARERLLWPRGIRIGRGSVPVVARYREGEWDTRPGAAPADVLSGWLADREVAPGPLRDGERRVLTDTAARRAQHMQARGRGGGRGAE